MEAAIGHFNTGLGIVERTLGPEHVNLSRGLQPLGTLLAEQGRWAEAATVFRRLVSVYDSAVGAEHRWVGEALNKSRDEIDRVLVSVRWQAMDFFKEKGFFDGT